MSFSISFAARTIASARHKLSKENAPAAVKALIDKALDGLPQMLPLAPIRSHSDIRAQESSLAASGASPVHSSVEKPTLFGVFVEASGHVANPEDGYAHSSATIKVTPLFD